MEWELLAGLGDDDRRAVLASARRRRFTRREVIFHEGDPGDCVHLIAKGRVSVHTTTPLGDVAMLAILKAGDAFGELALVVPKAKRSATITALEPTETLVVFGESFDELRQRHPSIDRFLVSLLSTQVTRLSHQVTEFAFFQLETRVLRRIIDLCEIFGPNGDGLVEIPLTQADIAGLAGGTRPRVNEILRKAEEQGFLELARGRIVVTNPEPLRRRAGIR